MSRAFAEIAFTPEVRSAQHRYGSGDSYARFLEPAADRQDRLGAAEASFIGQRDGFYQATVSETGWPYVQFRGGPPGFLQVLDDRTLAYADFRGNRQYLSTGNLTANDRIALILVDYPNRRRLKLWGRARLAEAADDPGMLDRLRPAGYRATAERSVLITVAAFDWNCPQHIPQRMTAAEFEPQIAALRSEVACLRLENEALKRNIAPAL